MSIKEQLDADLKTALLGGDKTMAMTLRGLKSAILNVEIAKGNRETGGLNDQEIIELFSKEAKKRQESADLYVQGGNQEKADAELLEKRVIETFLPKQLSDDELQAVVDQVVEQMGSITQAQMGQAIGQVRAQVGAAADGGRIAAAVKGKIES
jgi:uncharacterized protein YqeY